MRLEPIVTQEQIEAVVDEARDIFGNLNPYMYSAATVLPQWYETAKQFTEMVEIGTWRGLSALIFASWGLKVHTFDILEQEHCRPLWERFGADIDQHVCHDRDEIRDCLDGLNFDFAFIDGVHNYEGVKADFEMVKRCGHVLFHDYHKDRFPGIYQFVNEIGGVAGFESAWWPAQGFLMCDVTSNCNLRCPFCVTDWRSVTGNVNMSQAEFLRMLDRAKASSLFCMCAYCEPTLHPDLDTLLGLIPVELKDRAFISTNLALPLSDERIAALARSNLSTIVVSLESLDLDTYEFFRRGAQFDVFIGNLERLSAGLKRPQAPALQFVTMLFRQNAGQIRQLVEECGARFAPAVHEIRTPWPESLARMSDEFKAASLLTAEEVEAIMSGLTDLPIHWRVDHEGTPRGLAPVIYSAGGQGA